VATMSDSGRLCKTRTTLSPFYYLFPITVFDRRLFEFSYSSFQHKRLRGNQPTKLEEYVFAYPHLQY
jgi:hypothetical protein